MAVRASWMEPKRKVHVGMFSGVIVRVVEWKGDIKIDVEVDGVVDRYPSEMVEPVEVDNG